MENVSLYVVEGFLPLETMESIWFQRLVDRLCPRLIFSSYKVFAKNVMFALMQKTLVEYVFLKLPIYVLSMCTFDLWTSKRPHNVFGVIVNFMLKNWEPKHITISLFQASYTINATMAFQFLQLLTSFSYLEGLA